MGITTAVLTYNEEENIKKLLPQIIEQLQKVTDDFEIIIVDSDKSTDNTKEVCNQYQNVKFYVQEGPYYSDAVKTAIKYSSKEIILFMDADFSHPSEYISKMYNTFTENNADIVIGSRYVKGGSTDDYKKNILYSKFLNLVYRVFSGCYNIQDISGGYKMYKTSLLKNIDFISRYFEVQIELLVKAKIEKPDLKVIEIPIHFQKREEGVSKRNYFKFLPSFIRVFIKLFFFRIFH